MDNQKCERTYKKLVKERIIYGKGYGIEPIRGEEIEKRKQEQYQYGVYKVASRGVQRTQKEYEAIANYENKTFMKERLTSLARENIKKVRREHEEDRKKDEELYQMMKDADKMRENLKQSKEQVENRIKKEVLGLTLDHKNVAQSVKKDFIK